MLIIQDNSRAKIIFSHIHYILGVSVLVCEFIRSFRKFHILSIFPSVNVRITTILLSKKEARVSPVV